MHIETLLVPILVKICEYCHFRECGFEVSQDVMLGELRSDLADLQSRCAREPLLNQQYQSVYKPLIFFIDYTIKEGNFSYSASYQELARTFNEFSGDDKFFDLLGDNLHRDDDKELTRLFYIFMGLGFDGYYKRQRGETIKVMKNCLERLPPPPDFNHEQLTPEAVAATRSEYYGSSHGFFHFVRRNLVKILLVLTVFSFLGSYYAYQMAVQDFEQAIHQSVVASAPYNGKQEGAGKQSDPILKEREEMFSGAED